MRVVCSKTALYHGSDFLEHVFHDVVDFGELPEKVVKGSKEAKWTEDMGRSELFDTEQYLQKTTDCKRVDTESIYFHCVGHPEWSYGVIIARNGSNFSVNKYDEACCYTYSDPIIRTAQSANRSAMSVL